MGDGLMVADVYELNRDQIAEEFKVAEAEFRRVLGPTVADLGWRAASLLSSLSDHLARSADLILTAVDDSDYFDDMRRVNTGDLIMQAGRPVLLVPTLADNPRLERVMIARRTRARRAVPWSTRCRCCDTRRT